MTESLLAPPLRSTLDAGDPQFVRNRADMLEQLAEIESLLDEAEAMLATEEPLVRVRYLLERGRTFNSSGERDAASLPQTHGSSTERCLPRRRWWRRRIRLIRPR